jgi:glycosyltransferase involved in cell wall biosynthesis
MDYGSDLKVSFSILTHNETDSLRKLIEQLSSIKTIWDEIIIVDDYSDNPETIKILSWASDEKGAKVFRNKLNNDFAQQKNFANSKCSNEYIFNIDADELLDDTLAKTFKEILKLNRDVEMYRLPRINKVSGITSQHIGKWGWQISKLDSEIEEKSISRASDEYRLYKSYNLIIFEDDKSDKIRFFTPIINFPDLQGRIYKNNPNIKWVKPVHETLVGFKNYGTFPLKKEYCLLHDKEIKRQEMQNDFYSKIGK